MQRHYGLGGVWAIPSGANPTAIPLATLQDVSLDFSQDKKPLNGGGYRYAIDMADGEAKITVKAKFKEVNAATFKMVMGGSAAAGTVIPAKYEAGTIPAPSGPYTITVAQSANFVQDLGVADLATGKFLTCVAAGPATGQFSVAAGVYTFAAADASHAVAISYAYSAAGASAGQTLTLNNTVMGSSTPYVLTVYDVFGGKPLGFKFHSAHATKLGLALKPSDWMDEDCEFQCIANATGNVATIYTGE